MASRPSILVLEDDDATRELLQDMLCEEYQVYPACDTLEAADCLGLNRIDLLIVDLNLPILDGAEFIRTVRDQPRLRHIPVFVITAYPELISRLDGLNVEALLRKPFALSELNVRVKELLSGSNLWDQLQNADGGWMERDALLYYSRQLGQDARCRQRRVMRRLSKSQARLIRVESRLRASGHLLRASAYHLGTA